MNTSLRNAQVLVVDEEPPTRATVLQANTVSRAALISGGVINLSITAWAWGHWSTTAALVVYAVAISALNVALDAYLTPRIGTRRAESVRVLMNAAAMTLQGYLSGWALPNLLWLPFTAMLTDRSRISSSAFILVALAINNLGAYLGGVPAQTVATFDIAALVGYLVMNARVEMIGHLVKEREARNVELVSANGELKAMHEHVVAQEKLSSLGLLAAGVAHEINNPMSYVGSNLKSLAADLDALRTDPKLYEEYRTEVIPETLDGVRRVNAIVADLRRFARGDPEAMIQYDLDDQVRTAARISATHFSGGHSLELQLGCHANAMGRPGQIVQVLLNLIVNAAQSLAETGTVTVSTGSTGNELWFSVLDTGSGMDEGTKKKLFQPFFTTKAVGQGTGLGLAAVHGIVSAHSGTISVQTRPGAGTCFTVKLPLIPEPAVAASGRLLQLSPSFVPVRVGA